MPDAALEVEPVPFEYACAASASLLFRFHVVVRSSDACPSPAYADDFCGSPDRRRGLLGGLA